MPQLAMALRPGETALQVWRAGLQQDYVGYEDGDTGTFSINGLLIATDRRLIFVQEKGLLGKSYKPLESMEFGQMARWSVSQFMRVKGLVVDMSSGRNPRKTFQNLYEVDPISLKALNPWPVEQVQALLQSIIGRKG